MKIKQLLLNVYHRTYNYKMGEVVTLHRLGEWDNDRLYSIEELKVTIPSLQRYVDTHRETHDFISLAELEERLKKRSRFQKPFICITLDDGYKDNLTIGLPFFEKNNIPFGLFVTTNFIEKRPAFNWPFIVERILKANDSLLIEGKTYRCANIEEKNDVFQQFRKMILDWDYQELEQHFYSAFQEYITDEVLENLTMTWDDVKKISQSKLCTIGSHCVSHCRNSVMKDEDVLREFSESKKILEEQIGKEVRYIAYPFGCATDVRTDVGKFANQAGYTLGFTVGGIIRRNLKNQYMIPRVLLYNEQL